MFASTPSQRDNAFEQVTDADTPSGTGYFDTVLIANRGEIACRVIRTVQDLGLRAVAVYSDADAGAPHVTLADKAVHIGPAAATESYLVIDKIIDAAKASGAQAIHPGYGFLSENADFARRLEAEGLIFIGPPASAIDAMGDKIDARATVESRDVPTVPGISRPGLSDQDIIDAAPEIGFPVLIKPSAGGGGKGMHRVEKIEDLPKALVSARREAASSFGDDTLFLEHFVDTPRHIEVQVVADGYGNVIHLGERECSLQRRHQKVIEEAPSALLDEETRASIGAAACDAARACGYRGAGTVEFIVSAHQPDRFFFMEMNTRLQVEHPVTEQVTGVDLVEWQIRVARGERFILEQDDIELTGHSVEARIYAEDPAAGFLPTGGTITDLVWPEDGARVDSGVREGQTIGSDYDPMLAKVISYGVDRDDALAELADALDHTHVGGLRTNIAFNHFLVTHPQIVAGDMDTGLIDRIVDDYADPITDDLYYALAAAYRLSPSRTSATLADAASASTTPGGAAALGTVWTRADAWRGAMPASHSHLLFSDGTNTREVVLTPQGEDTWQVTVAAPTVLKGGESQGAGAAGAAGADADAAAEAEGDAAATELTLLLRPAAEVEDMWEYSVDGDFLNGVFLSPADHLDGVIVETEERVAVLTPVSRAAVAAEAAAGSGAITSPMPGTVISVEAADGDTVEADQAVVVIEAMKMEHTLTAAIAGQVSISVSVGDKVNTGEVLATVTPADED